MSIRCFSYQEQLQKILKVKLHMSLMSSFLNKRKLRQNLRLHNCTSTCIYMYIGTSFLIFSSLAYFRLLLLWSASIQFAHTYKCVVGHVKCDFVTFQQKCILFIWLPSLRESDCMLFYMRIECNDNKRELLEVEMLWSDSAGTECETWWKNRKWKEKTCTFRISLE